VKAVFRRSGIVRLAFPCGRLLKVRDTYGGTLRELARTERHKDTAMDTDVDHETALNWKSCITLSQLSDDEFEALALDTGEFAYADEGLTYYLAMSPEGQPYLRAAIGA